jgi:MATE family multidrug resistance protein
MTNFEIEASKEYAKLTKHPSGSLKELFVISFPLMLSFLSNYLMLFFDRLILANYSLEAMNAASAAALFCMVFQYGAIGITSVAEVFVGQYNGSKRYNIVASPVWQMIWFSIMLFPIFFLVAKFTGSFFLPDYHFKDFGLPYFQWILYFNVFVAISTSLASFFIGIGKVKLITIVTIISNILNILLDLILIFGIKNFIPPLATKGAAIATGISQVFQVILLFFFFLNKKNNKKYKTHHLRFKPKLIIKCLKVGAPSAIGHVNNPMAKARGF